MVVEIFNRIREWDGEDVGDIIEDVANLVRYGTDADLDVAEDIVSAASASFPEDLSDTTSWWAVDGSGVVLYSSDGRRGPLLTMILRKLNGIILHRIDDDETIQRFAVINGAHDDAWCREMFGVGIDGLSADRIRALVEAAHDGFEIK